MGDNSGNAFENARGSVYGGPLEDFVRRRDSLAKELRSGGDRESAAAIKALRKPARVAWALNLATLSSPDAIVPLVDAVTDTIAAQAGGGDVRGAIANLRAAVRELANQAAHAAAQAGHIIEAGVLSNAVLAVLGHPESFIQLRGGYLADVPEAGGLDFLASLPVPEPSSAKPHESAPAQVSAIAPQRLDAAAQEAARHAARALADARRDSERADAALRAAETMLATAEDRLRKAEDEARVARRQCDDARQSAESAAAKLGRAEDAVAEAERQLAGESDTARAY